MLDVKSIEIRKAMQQKRLKLLESEYAIIDDMKLLTAPLKNDCRAYYQKEINASKTIIREAEEQLSEIENKLKKLEVKENDKR